MKSPSSFSAQSLNRLIRRARAAIRLPEDGPDGWTKVSDLSPITDGFDRLRLKPGIALRAYLFRENGNGNGFVYAMPAHVDFPDADECATDASRFLEPPAPKEALADVMTAIEGDGTPMSFAQGSILARELCEFGACWHGCEWSTHTILDKDPRQNRIRVSYMDALDPASWVWSEVVEDWRPRVEISPNPTFTFYTHSGLGQERIIRHTDVFAASGYTFEMLEREVALGPSGFVF